MFDKKYFTVTENHLKLMRQMIVGYEEHCEFGAPEIDPKRPYGNRDAYSDIGRILGIAPEAGSEDDPEYSEEQEEAMLMLHKQTAISLQIALSTSSFEIGQYQAVEYSDRWEKV